jgi:hypothetical protein
LRGLGEQAGFLPEKTKILKEPLGHCNLILVQKNPF